MGRSERRRSSGVSGRGGFRRRSSASSARPGATSRPTGVAAGLANRFVGHIAAAARALGAAAAIDRRALGIFRVAFGLVLLADLACRVRGRDFDAFYTDDGVLPIADARSSGALRPTLFALAHTHLEAGYLMAAIAAVYALYTIGAATRWMQVLVVIAHVSLDARNPILRNGGVDVANALAVWTALLPLGSRFSFDAWRRGGCAPRSNVLSVATGGAIFNLALIYCLGCIQKTGVTWRDGTAVHYTLWSNRFATPLAAVLRMHEPAWLAPVLTYGTLAIEASLPILILSPLFRERTRGVAVGLIAAFHGGLALFMELGCFPWVMMAYSTLLLGPRACRRLEARAGRLWRRFGASVTRGGVEAPLADGGGPPIAAPVAPNRRAVLAAGVATYGREALAVVVLMTVVGDASTHNEIAPRPMRLERISRLTTPLVDTLGLRQRWQLFAPDPPTRESVLFVDARLADGTHVDPLTGKVPDLHAPEHGPYLDDSQWSHLRRHILEGRNASMRAPLWAYILRTDVRERLDASKRVVAFKAYRVAGSMPPPGSTEWTRVTAEEIYAWPAVHHLPTAVEDLSTDDGAL